MAAAPPLTDEDLAGIVSRIERGPAYVCYIHRKDADRLLDEVLRRRQCKTPDRLAALDEVFRQLGG
jgi:hypothetical protein